MQRDFLIIEMVTFTFPTLFFFLVLKEKKGEYFLVSLFTWLQIALIFYGISIPMILYSLNIAYIYIEAITFFDFYITPILIIILFTYNSKQINRKKETTYDLDKIRKLESLGGSRDPRFIFSVFWLTVIYMHFFG